MRALKSTQLELLTAVRVLRVALLISSKLCYLLQGELLTSYQEKYISFAVIVPTSLVHREVA